jgi:hypothetical protein
MSYQNKDTWKGTTAGSFTPGSDQWTGTELEDALINMADSVAWEGQKYTMTTNTYDCSIRNLQERTLGSNSTLTITNAEAGKYYTLIVKGNYTFTLPTSEYQVGGAVIPASTSPRVLTFLYDGTDYYFSHATYSAT